MSPQETSLNSDDEGLSVPGTAGSGRRRKPPLTPQQRRGWRRFGLAASAVPVLLLHSIGTYITWENTCSMGWGEAMKADPDSTLGRFCLAESAYNDDIHFVFWIVPIVGFLLVGFQWVEGRSRRWMLAAALIGALLALVYYTPFLLLPR